MIINKSYCFSNLPATFYLAIPYKQNKQKQIPYLYLATKTKFLISKSNFQIRALNSTHKLCKKYQ